MTRTRIARSQTRFYQFCLIFLCGLVAVGMPISPRPVLAATEYGYLWKLDFNFDNSFNGVLTVEVGPWQNGNLISVEETSVTRVACQPVGNVTVKSGVATFDGSGYLSCSMNIGEVVRSKHNLKPKNPDTYGSILMRTRAKLSNDGPAPIFAHPDANFRLDPQGPLLINIGTDLSNNNTMMTSLISNVNWNDWQVNTSTYWCVNPVACTLEHMAGPYKTTMANQGTAVTFATGLMTFTIGKDDSGILNGQIDAIRIDPGNFVH